VGSAQGRFDRSDRGDVSQAGFLQFLKGVVADHSGNHRLASLQGLDDGVELAMPEGMIRIKGAVLFHLHLVHLPGIPLVELVDQETLGMTEVLIDLGARFRCNSDAHIQPPESFTTENTEDIENTKKLIKAFSQKQEVLLFSVTSVVKRF
jgi:hypothetical protein